MRNVLSASLMLIACFPFALNAQSLKPLPTEFVDCVTNERGAFIASRKEQTPMLTSSIGSIAYAEVSAETSGDGDCENNTTVYIAERNGGAFRPVLRQGEEHLPDSSIYDGNGVAYLSWSPSGKNLLAVVFQWTYGTDGGGNYKYLLIEEDNSAKLILPERAIWEQFKKPCYASISFNGWIDNRRIGLEVRPFVAMDDEDEPDPTPSCVKEATTFSFDLGTKEASPNSPVGNNGNSHR